MSQIKIGDYVRTSKGRVGKVVREDVNHEDETVPVVKLGEKEFQIHPSKLVVLSKVSVAVQQGLSLHVYHVDTSEVDAFISILNNNKIFNYLA